MFELDDEIVYQNQRFGETQKMSNGLSLLIVVTEIFPGEIDVHVLDGQKRPIIDQMFVALPIEAKRVRR